MKYLFPTYVSDFISPSVVPLAFKEIRYLFLSCTGMWTNLIKISSWNERQKHTKTEMKGLILIRLDMNMQLVTWSNPITPEVRYSRFDHVPTACSYLSATQKMIFYFLYLYSYLSMMLLGFHNIWKADLNNDLLTRNIVRKCSSHYKFEQINNA